MIAFLLNEILSATYLTDEQLGKIFSCGPKQFKAPVTKPKPSPGV